MRLDMVILLSEENKIELRRAQHVLLKSIFEATEVKTPTCFVILRQRLAPAEQHGTRTEADIRWWKYCFDKGMKWVNRMENIKQHVSGSMSRDGVFDAIGEALGDLVVAERMYFYLIDELTAGAPVQCDGYPIEITSPAAVVSKLLRLMQLTLRSMSLYNGVMGVARMFGYPLPTIPTEWQKWGQDAVNLLKKESSVEEFGSVHERVKKISSEPGVDGADGSVRGAALRELVAFFEQYDPHKKYGGLNHYPDEWTGLAIWTLCTTADDMSRKL